MRAVFDPNVLISAILALAGTPARLLSRWLGGDFEIIVSSGLLAELERALAYDRLQTRVPPKDATAYVAFIRETADVLPDPRNPPARSSDAGDDYLIALAEAGAAVLVSGDRHLTDLGSTFPVRTPREFLAMLDQ